MCVGTSVDPLCVLCNLEVVFQVQARLEEAASVVMCRDALTDSLCLLCSVSVEFEADQRLEGDTSVFNVSISGGRAITTITGQTSQATLRYQVCYIGIYGSLPHQNLRSRLCVEIHVIGPQPEVSCEV